MAIGKWIGGFLGFMTGGPLGALAGFALGAIFDRGIDEVNQPYNHSTFDGDGSYGQGTSQEQQYRYHQQQIYEGQRNSFRFSMLVLASYIIKADGKVMHSEMELVRRMLRDNFGEQAVHEGEQILLKLFEKQKEMGAAQYRSVISSATTQIAGNFDYSSRLQLLNFLVIIAQADGVVHPSEVQALREVTIGLQLSMSDLDSMLNLRNGATDFEAAYKVLGVSPKATDQEVKAAYRRLALQHHPDKVATLGEDVRKAAEKKFKEINDAKEKIFKARGI